MISALRGWFLNQVIASINWFLFKFWYNSNSNSDINRYTLAWGVCNPIYIKKWLEMQIAIKLCISLSTLAPSTLQGNSSLKSLSHLPRKTLTVFFTCHTAETLLFSWACLTILQFLLEMMPSQFIQHGPAHIAAHSRSRNQEAASLTQFPVRLDLWLLCGTGMWICSHN